MTPLKTFSNAKAALHRNKSSCLLHTGQTAQHGLPQIHKSSTRFSEAGTPSPSELNHFPFCWGNCRALPASASLQLQTLTQRTIQSFPYTMRDGRSLHVSCVKNLPGTESKSPSTFARGQQTKHSKSHTEPQYPILPPLPWYTWICSSLVLV